MKSYATLTILAALAAAMLSTTAQAEGLSRDQVVAELSRARAAGELDHASAEIDRTAAASAYRAPTQWAMQKDKARNTASTSAVSASR